MKPINYGIDEVWYNEQVGKYGDSFPPMDVYLKNPELFSDENREKIVKEAISQTPELFTALGQALADSFLEAMNEAGERGKLPYKEPDPERKTAYPDRAELNEYGRQANHQLHKMGLINF